jgi:hypothetical protein
MRCFLPALGCWCVAYAADAPKPAPSALDGLAEAAAAAEQQSQATLDGGSTIGLIPLSAPSAPRTIMQFAAGFFREEDAKLQPPLPVKVAGLAGVLPQLKTAGATHVIALSHEGAGDVEYVRFVALGDFTSAALASLEKAGLGRRDAEGAFELAAYVDGKEMSAGLNLPPLPVARLTQMARQLAAESDCTVDVVALASRDAARSFEDALKEAFTEEGEAAAKTELPSKARQLSAQLPELRTMGASHLIVTAFQNRRGADVVLVVAKGIRDADSQAKVTARFGAHAAADGSLILARWVDGEEKGGAEAPSAAKAEAPPVRRGKFR